MFSLWRNSLSTMIQAVRGMRDILPDETPFWRYFERVITSLLTSYGYQEVRFPIVEKTELFKRSIGEITDIVEKEMYTFEDRNGDSLTLRPEGTAACVRMGVEKGLFHNQIHKLWYMGPMFRHERPQKGRYRQFHQVGVETFGLQGPDIDAELILICRRLWNILGLQNNVRLELNSLGQPEDRVRYREKIVEYFNDHFQDLDDDSQKRLATNPMRILDSKNPDTQKIVADAPVLSDYLSAKSAEHFQQLREYLYTSGVEYTVNPRLVRGLDYYSDTVFEWITQDLGAQGTVCAGGRFDALVSYLGGKPTPAAGFAMGIERLIALLESLEQVEVSPLADCYLVVAGEKAQAKGLQLAESVHNSLPQLRVITHCGGGSFKSQMKKADKSGARIALIMGDDEVDSQTITVKYLRETVDQQTIAQDELVATLQALFQTEDKSH